MSNIKKEVTDGCGIITVNRPEALNALNSETINALKEAFRHFYSREEIGVVILTGEGHKAFIAGADIKEMAPLDTAGAVEFAHKGQDLTNFIDRFPKPVIAAVNGYALGGGCEIALACHFRIASENAKFGQPEVKLGIIPGWGGTQRLPRLVGRGNAIEMITTGEMISAQRAKEIGLVNHVVPSDELLPKSLELARAILKCGPTAVKIALDAIQHGVEMRLTEGLKYEANLFGLAFGTDDKQEGISAFLDKRSPKFRQD